MERKGQDYELRNSNFATDRNCRALCVRAGRVSWLSSYLARAAAVAHAFDVGDECYFGYLAGWFDRDRRFRTWQGGDNPGFRCSGVFDYERGRRICDHGPHAAHVQTQGRAEEVIRRLRILHRTKTKPQRGTKSTK